MENSRFRALETATSREIVNSATENCDKISCFYGEMTFNASTMQQYLSREAYNKVLDAMEKGEQIDRKSADEIAAGMKAWSIAKGATHYTHWFQPLTGSSAEKHDAFLTITKDGRAIEHFNGSSLVQQEPDASSFPNGGIRNTFEARGYTAWDPTSPAFIIEKTLCIPTIFVSYTGEALDYKAPLVKSLHSLDEAATEVCKMFDSSVRRVKSTLGIEQEYFLVDEALYYARPDLVLTGRTLFGHASAKDQQLEDNYFGSIPERVVNFMKDFEYQSFRLGIPLHTRHNEVAPNQFECAPQFEEANLAIDHNVLLMDLMQKVSRHHKFRVLFHEKPYAGVNGSGKHNNWSLMTDKGENLLSPGSTPHSNLQFLTFFLNVIKAVNDKSDLLRASIASASNDMRLGGNEAPPAIMSVFIGDQLTRVLESIEKSKKSIASFEENESRLSINVARIPEILPDNTDRNRTSPFAFTGNKFEFRAVGSSTNPSAAIIALNTIIADQLLKFKDEVDVLMRKKLSREEAISKILKRYVTETCKIRFDGNNYSQEWVEEAERRGLSNIKSTPEALKAFVEKDVIRAFEEHKVLTKRELEARMEIKYENYVKKIQIESRAIGDLALNHVIPVAIRYQNVLIENVKGLREILEKNLFMDLSKNQMQNIREISEHISQIISLVNQMVEERKVANRIESFEERAMAYRSNVLPYFENIRFHTDALELLVDDELWPLPKYRELLFVN